MIIHVKNKNTLIIDDFKLKCCIGKNGLKSNKIEGDYSTPKGLFSLKKLYFREDQVGIPKCSLNKKPIQRNMAWCDDPKIKNIMKKSECIIKNSKKVYIEKTIDTTM